MSFIVTINAVLEDGKHDDIVAIGVVENEEAGELWFNTHRPTDGTQVDYVRHDIETVFAAPALLEALKYARDIIAAKVEPCAHAKTSALSLIKAAIDAAE